MSIFKPSKKTNNSHLKNLRIKITARFGQFPKSSKPSQPISEDAIRQRAFELWQARGGHRSDIDNWNEAKRQLEQEQIQRTKVLRKIASLANKPLIFVEKSFLEPCADWFERAAIFQIIEKLSPIIEAIGVLLIPLAIWWFTESNEGIKDRQEKAVRGQQAVQNYLNQLSNILLQGGVEKLENNKQLQNIMRASTLALFENPDLQSEENDENTVDRKGQVIKYLSETELIQSLKIQNKSKSPIISLREANLQGADLLGANLQGADLLGANLQGANLRRAILLLANLQVANLQGAYLQGAYLQGAYLLLANLQVANLQGADLEGAYLQVANLEGADLRWADLEGAYLQEANLQGAYLEGANLQRANLQGANLQGAKYTDKSTNPEVCKQMFLLHPCPTKFPTGFDPKASKMELVKEPQN